MPLLLPLESSETVTVAHLMVTGKIENCTQVAVERDSIARTFLLTEY